MPIQENQDPTEARLDPVLGMAPDDAPDVGGDEEGDEPKPRFADADVLTFLGDTKRRSRTYQQTVVLGMWENSEAAYRSEHGSTSKYKRDQYKNRAKYFKPKTRAAVRKNLTATRNALFSSQDVLSCEPEDDSNELQRANAALIKELLNSRLNNKTMRYGVPWYQISLGARLDTQKLGVCVSKQEWSYRVVEREEPYQEERPYLDEAGEPLIDAETGEAFTEIVDGVETIKDVVIDKPVITLIRAEMVLLDPATGWIDPAQNSPTLIVQHPMHIDAVKAMMEDEEKSFVTWRVVSDETLRGAFYSESELLGLKTARDGGQQQASNRSSSAFGGLGNEVVEVWECFFRRGGEDYHCWSLKAQALLSDPTPTMEVYPALRGIRPYVIGTDALEAHVLYPQSHVDAWKQAQDEINDFANLNMDGTRQSVFPTAKVKAGRNIDYKSVQKRDAQGIILVRDMDDVTWDRPNANTNGVDRQVQLLSNDFDDLAGIFSQNSVQSNRQIGDTVGGMQLIAANANATSEFDLSCFLETWAEPVLSQLVMLEQYYEDDATLLMVAGNKAKLFQKFGVSEITDELLESQVQLRLNVGIGGSDPMQSLIKFKSTFDIAMPMLGLAMKEGKAEVNFEEIFAEIFSKAGYRNGAERFIKLKEGGQPAIPPEMVQELTQKLQQLQGENETLKSGIEVKAAGEAAKIEIEGKKLAFEQDKFAYEVWSDKRDRDAKGKEQVMAHDQVLMSAGYPPNAVIAEMSASREAMVGAIAQSNEMVARALQSLAAAQLAPKRVVTDANGRPVGVEVAR